MEYIKFSSHLPLRSNYLNSLFDYLNQATKSRFSKVTKNKGIVLETQDSLGILYNGGSSLIIKKGFALDNENNRIEVLNDVVINLNTLGKTPGEYFIVIYYKEEIDVTKFDWKDGIETGNPNDKIYPYTKESYVIDFVRENELQEKHIKLAKCVLSYDGLNYFLSSLDLSVRDIYSLNVWGNFGNQIISFQDHLNQIGHGLVTPNNPHGLSIEDISGLNALYNEIISKNCLILKNINTNNSGLNFDFWSDSIKTNNYIKVYLLKENEFLILNKLVYSKEDFDVSEFELNNGYKFVYVSDEDVNEVTYYIIARRNNSNGKIIIIKDITYNENDFVISSYKLVNNRIDPYSLVDYRRIGFLNAEVSDPIFNIGTTLNINTLKGNREYNLFYVKVPTLFNLGDLTSRTFSSTGSLILRTDFNFIDNRWFYKVWSNYNYQTDQGDFLEYGFLPLPIDWENKSWGNISERWKIVLSGYIRNVGSSILNLTILTDDGVKIYLDNQLLLNQWELFANKTFSIDLIPPNDSDWHKIEIHHFNNLGPERFKLIFNHSNYEIKTENIFTFPISFLNYSLFELISYLNNLLNDYRIFVRLSLNKTQLNFFTYNFLEIINTPSNLPLQLFKIFENEGLLQRIEISGNGIVGKQYGISDKYFQEFFYDENENISNIYTNLKDFKITNTYVFSQFSMLEKIIENVV
ncbi:MAG: hypothetical protein QXY18_00945 [Nitrososphaerota archaeon]